VLHAGPACSFRVCFNASGWTTNPDWSAASAACWRQRLELEDYSLQARAVAANLFLADVAASEQLFLITLIAC